MDKGDVRRLVERSLIRHMAASGNGYYVPVAVSNRHVHLCGTDIDKLFGRGYALSKLRDLSQPGQYACEEVVTVAGKKGSVSKVRVLGPARARTQVEILLSDSFRLGIPAEIRMSGELGGTPGCTLIGPAGSVELAEGVIVAARHLHLSAEEAAWFGLHSGDMVSVRKQGLRPVRFGRVMVRAGAGHSLEVHIDTDEANAAGMLCGEILELVKDGTV